MNNDELEELEFENFTDDEVFMVSKVRKLKLRTNYRGIKKFILKK